MSQSIYKIIEVVGTSATSIEEAIEHAIQEASKTLKNLDWFEIIQTRGHISDNKVQSYQVIIKIGFRIE